MKAVNSNSEVIEKIKNNKMTILYFSGASCGACDVIKGKVEKLLIGYPNVEAVEVNAVVNQSLAAEYSIFTLPVLVLFAGGREVTRVGRYLNMIELHNNIDRYYEMLF